MTRKSLAHVVAVAVAATTMLPSMACRPAASRADDRMPGRSRPIMTHEWKHPRDLKFAASTFTPPDPGQLIRTSSGVKAFVLSTPRATLVRFTAAMPLGRLFERSGESGASDYFAQMLANPAGFPGSEALTARLASMGTRTHVDQFLDATRVSVEVLQEDWREGLSVFVSLLRNLKPDPASISSYRTGLGYAAVLAGTDGAGFRPAVELQRMVAGYPLAPADPGLTLSPQRANAMIARSLSPTAIIIGIAGDVSRDDAVKSLEEATAGWVSNGDALTRASIEGHSATVSMKTIDAPILEGWIAIGRWINRVPASDHPSLAVMAEVLGERLNIAAREIRGLANRDNFVLPQEADDGGLIHIRTGGRPEAVAPLVKFSLDEVRRLASDTDPISAEELERAKGALILGKWQASLDGVRTASDTYALEFLRHGNVDRVLGWPDAVRTVTADQAKAAAKRYLDPAQMTTVIVGPLDKIRASRHPRWPASIDEVAGR